MQLLAAAERAIAAIGPDVTMDQIAAEADVTKPILYRTVGDKAAVVDALSDLLVDRIAQTISASVASGGDPREYFTASVRAYLAAVETDRNLYVFVNSTDQHSRSLRSRIDRSAQQLVDMFADAHIEGASSTSPLTWAHSIVGALQTVTLMWIDVERDTDHDARTIDHIADDITDLLWPGFVAILGADSSPPTA